MSRNRRILSGLVRWAFVAAVLVFAVISFRDEWPSILASVASIPFGILLLAFALVTLGTVASVPVWRGLLSAVGSTLAWAPASRILLVGQLGKYIPGSVWSVGAQARLAQPYSVPLRSALSASTAYIGYHLAGSVAVASVGILLGWISIPVPVWVAACALVIAVAPFVPPIANRLVGVVAGLRARLSWSGVSAALGLSAVSWGCWGASIALLAASNGPTELLSSLGPAIAAYALAYAAGLLVIIAPAGFGVREGVLVALLTPTFGLAAAAGVAVIARLISTLSDFFLAIVTQLWDPRRKRPAPPPSAPEP